MFCPKCGMQNEEDAKFCKKCALELPELGEGVGKESETAENAEQTIPAQETKPDKTDISDPESTNHPEAPMRKRNNRRNLMDLMDAETIEPSPQTTVNKNQKITITAIGLTLVIAAIAGFVVINTLNHGPSSAIQNEEQAVQNETKGFVSEYGNRYSDPVSVYYAEKAYTAESKSLLMTDDEINNYDLSAPRQGEVSPLGFGVYKLPLNAEVSQATSIEIFNKYTSKQMELYMDALARNPSPEATAIIDSQFRDYCSNSDETLPALTFKDDDEPIIKLMNTCKAIVSKHGSAANYTVSQGSNDNSDSKIFADPNATYFYEGEEPFNQVVDEKGVVNKFANNADIVIFVDVYNGKNVHKSKEIVKNATLSIIRQPKSGPFDFTLISIGQY